MKNNYFKCLALLLLVTGSTFAQIGVNTTAPASTLDVVATNATGTTTNVDGITIPRVTRERAQSMVSVPTSTMIYVTEVTTGSTTGTTANVTAIGFYFFNGTLWEKINTGTPSADWSLTGNSGTTAGTNYIGTNDVQDLVVKTSAVANTPLERMRVTAAGNVGINAPTPTATALLTINPNTNAISSGIDMTMTNANSAATGLNINADNANVNGIAVTHSSTSSSSSFYGIGSVLSATNIVSGYNGYRTGSGLSYGLYGINGTTGTYATNANTWAAFLRGRTVISSEGSPSSPVGTDLEVRNTTTGSAAPATVSLRQSTSLATNGNVLANLNFGDNYTTAPQAQIRVLRDAAAGSATDMPTAMTFSTTADGGSTLTERMRISNSGTVGINTTPTSTLDVSAINSTGTSTNVDGLSIPRVTRQRAQSMTAANIAVSTMIFVSEVATGTATGITINVTAVGLYYWDGSVWQALKTSKNNTTIINQYFPSYLFFSDEGAHLTNNGYVSITNWNPTTAIERQYLTTGTNGIYYAAAAMNLTSLSLTGWVTNYTGSGNGAFTVYIVKYSLGTASVSATATVTGTSIGSQSYTGLNAGSMTPITVNVPAGTTLAAGDVLLCMIKNDSNNDRIYEFGGQLQITN